MELMELMEYQNIIKLLSNTPNQPSKFKEKNCVEIIDEWRGTYNEDNQIRFKNSMLRSNLCDYRDAYILVKGTITVEKKVAQDQPSNAANEKAIFKNCALFSNCISRINNTQVDGAHECQCII